MKILWSLGLSVVAISIAISGFAQNPINLELKKELDTILLYDQGIREFGDTETTDKRKDTLALLLNYPRAVLNKNAYAISRKIDSVNLEKVERIIKEYGYPGKTMVGEPANTAVFYVIQHSEKISTYYPLIEKAGKSGELP